MAEVFRGAIQGERGTGRAVAIKRLRPELKGDPAAVELFVHEAQVSLSLSHPNVVHALELIRDDQGYALVCEWLDGSSLAALRERLGPLPPACVAYLGQALIQALAYVHKSGPNGAVRVHRDVTPGNVFVTTDAQVKLADFGVALCHDRTPLVTIKVAGTPEFAAPEQLAGGTIDPRTDLFGLGATLRAVAGELPAALTAMLAQACAVRPEARFPSAESLGAAWNEAIAGLTPVPGAASFSAWCTEHGGLKSDIVAPSLDTHVSSFLKDALQTTPEAMPATKPVTSRRAALVATLGVGAALLGLGLWISVRTPVADPPVESIPVAAELSEMPLPPPVSVREEIKPERQSLRKASPVKRSGHVSLNAVPWASVELDGHGLGNTPLKGLELTEGRHLLILVNPAQNLRREIIVEIAGGARQTLLVDLRRGTVDRRIDPN
jgi:serine/threonine protein kinase